MDVPDPDVVYEDLSRLFSSAIDQLQMRRVKKVSYPAWRRANDGSSVFISLEVERRSTDPFAGGRFRIELENSKQSVPARGLNGRALFFQLLTFDETDVVLEQQNRVIESLPTPPANHIGLYPEGPVREQYLEWFQRQSVFDAVQCWLRYHSRTHIKEWAEILNPLLPRLVERAGENLDAGSLHLGQGSLLAPS
jgi:hypothetical protein